jgi:hypothetical protein
MRRWGLDALLRALLFLTWPCGGETRPHSSHAVHTFDNQVCEQLPSEGF